MAPRRGYLLSHWCVGLTAAWLWVVRVNGERLGHEAEALMQAHAAAWLVASATFAVGYLALPTVPSGPPMTPSPPTPLRRPLLDEAGNPMR